MYITLPLPMDAHLHLRDNQMLETTVAHSARSFSRAIIMPNLKQPVTNTRLAEAYRQRILSARPQGSNWTPLMTLYLTEHTTADQLEQAANDPNLIGVKLYPAGATTHAQAGVRNMDHITEQLAVMERCQLPLLVHGEVTDRDVDVFDREARFIEKQLDPMLKRFEGLRVVLEHITTADAAHWVSSMSSRVAATITAHHLIYNRNALFEGGLRPHYYCLPLLKSERHRLALRQAATSGSDQFFLGTDSAPHPQHLKESACGCAGIYSAHQALAFYAQVFYEEQALEHFENFAVQAACRFYGLEPSTQTITLCAEKKAHIPPTYQMGTNAIIPLQAGQTVGWQPLHTTWDD